MPEPNDPMHDHTERHPVRGAGEDAHTERHPAREAREHLHRSLDDAAKPEPDHASHERNAGVAIAVLAAVVFLLLIAIVSGATDAFRP